MMYKTPKAGLYALVNEKDKRVYISQSKDICSSLSRLLRNIYSKKLLYKQLIKDVKRLRFIYLENINGYDGYVDIAGKLDFHITLYKQLGYELYNNKYKLQKLRVVIEVQNDRFVYVKLVSKTYFKKMVVGVFDKMYDALEFSTLFETMDIITPIFAINNLTKEYFKCL